MNIQEVINNLGIDELLDVKQLIDDILDDKKNKVKESKEDIEIDGVKFKYSSYIKLKPKDINKVLEQYPLSEYPNLYNVSLAQGASSIITDESLFDEQEISSVRITR